MTHLQAKLLHYSVLRTTEVLEFTYWYIISVYCPRADTDQAYYELIVKKASALLSAVQVNMLKFALSLRAYSATVHSFQQVTYKSRTFVRIVITFPIAATTLLFPPQIASNEPPPSGCSAFFSVHGQKTCDPGSLDAMLKTAAARWLTCSLSK